jgi:hypothetical protein
MEAILQSNINSTLIEISKQLKNHPKILNELGSGNVTKVEMLKIENFSREAREHIISR